MKVNFKFWINCFKFNLYFCIIKGNLICFQSKS